MFPVDTLTFILYLGRIALHVTIMVCARTLVLLLRDGRIGYIKAFCSKGLGNCVHIFRRIGI